MYRFSHFDEPVRAAIPVFIEDQRGGGMATYFEGEEGDSTGSGMMAWVIPRCLFGSATSQ